MLSFHEKADVFSIAKDWYETHKGDAIACAIPDCANMYPMVEWNDERRNLLLAEIAEMSTADRW